MRLMNLAGTLLLVAVAVADGKSGDQGEEPRVVEPDQLIYRDGLKYEVDSDQPYTGWVVGYLDGEQKVWESEFVNGRQHGRMTQWYATGEKMAEAELRDGEACGIITTWFENGQKQWEADFREGKPSGGWTWWHENGRKRLEAVFEDGELITAECWDEVGDSVPCPEWDEEAGTFL